MLSIKVSKSTNEGPPKNNTGKWVLDILNQDIKLNRYRFDDKNKEKLFGELSLMIGSGLELNSALIIVKSYFKKSKDFNLIESLQKNLANGLTFNKSMEASNLFNTYDLFSVKIGEETGQLQQVLKELSNFYFKKIQLRRQVVSSLSYPAIVFVTAILAILFMMNFVIPMFAGVFARFNTDLPFITRMVIRFSKATSSASYYAMLFLPFIVIIYFKVRNYEKFRKVATLIVLRLPLIGKLVYKIHLARFCQSMKLLLTSKVTIIDALGLSQQMVNYYPIVLVLSSVKKDVIKGELLSTAFAKQSDFDIKFISMIKIGEEVNQLNIVFEKLESDYTRELDYQTKVITSIMEPLLILLLGIFVGVILVAMYLPMFKLGSEIH